MSLLSIISGNEHGAAALCNLPSPTSIINSTDPNVPLLLRLANQEGRELARRHDWQAIKVAYTVATIATEAQTALPSDFDRLLPKPDIWNRSLGLQYVWANDSEWEAIKALAVTSGSPGWVMLLGNALYITPAPTAGQTLAFRYMSTQWCQSAALVAQTYWQADTDTAKLPEYLIALGIIWRYKKSKGLDYAEDMTTYERALDLAASRDRGNRMIKLERSSREFDLPPFNWPGTVTP